MGLRVSNFGFYGVITFGLRGWVGKVLLVFVGFFVVASFVMVAVVLMIDRGWGCFRSFFVLYVGFNDVVVVINA